jgi:hypothetical protein
VNLFIKNVELNENAGIKEAVKRETCDYKEAN